MKSPEVQVSVGPGGTRFLTNTGKTILTMPNILIEELWLRSWTAPKSIEAVDVSSGYNKVYLTVEHNPLEGTLTAYLSNQRYGGRVTLMRVPITRGQLHVMCTLPKLGTQKNLKLKDLRGGDQ